MSISNFEFSNFKLWTNLNDDPLVCLFAQKKIMNSKHLSSNNIFSQKVETDLGNYVKTFCKLIKLIKTKLLKSCRHWFDDLVYSFKRKLIFLMYLIYFNVFAICLLNKSSYILFLFFRYVYYSIIEILKSFALRKRRRFVIQVLLHLIKFVLIMRKKKIVGIDRIYLTTQNTKQKKTRNEKWNFHEILTPLLNLSSNERFCEKM